MSGVRQTTRLRPVVAPDDLLYCRLGEHWDVAVNFARRGPNRAEASRHDSYRAYCKECHRKRNGERPQRLKSAGHSGSRTPEAIPSDIEAAYGMIRDFKAQQQGKPGYVYLIVEEGDTTYGKIGYSTNPQARVRELQTGNPRVLKLYATKLGTLADERALHERHKADNVLQEWFRLDQSLFSEWDVSEIIDEEAA